MKLRLFYIRKRGCYNTQDEIPSIFTVNELTTKFYPYISLEYLPSKYNMPGAQQGIILIAGDEVIRRNYTFEDPKDKKELEELIWTYVIKYFHPPEAPTYKDGCLKNFKVYPSNKVIQGWHNKLKDLASDT